MQKSKHREDKAEEGSAAQAKHSLGLHKLSASPEQKEFKSEGRESFVNLETDDSCVYCTFIYILPKATEELIWRSPDHFCHLITGAVLNREQPKLSSSYLRPGMPTGHTTADLYGLSAEITRLSPAITATASDLHTQPALGPDNTTEHNQGQQSFDPFPTSAHKVTKVSVRPALSRHSQDTNKNQKFPVAV